MDAETHAAPRRWWRDLRWITVLVIVVIVASLLWGLLGREPRIVVSRETTFITEPLRSDGLPDYHAHVLDLMGRGVPPEENAAVSVLHATWPMELDGPKLAAVCKELGVADTPPDVTPLVLAEEDEELKRLLTAFVATRQPPDVAGAGTGVGGEVGSLIERSRGEPWKAGDCPPLADWVARNSPALDLVVAGAARPRYVMPLADLLLARPGDMLLGVTLPELQTLRDTARSLTTRAMWHLGAGRTEAAWRDVHALHRLGRLRAPPGRCDFLLAHLVSVAVSMVANAATLEVLQSPDLTADEAAAIRRDLDALPDQAGAGDFVAMERLVAVDAVVQLAALGRAGRSRTLSSNGLTDAVDWRLKTSLDFNVVLRDLDDYYDRVDDAMRLPDRAARQHAFERIDADVAASDPPGWWRAARVLRAATNRHARSVDVGAQMTAMLGSTFGASVRMFDRARAEFDLLRVAAALAEYRVRGLGGQKHPYPERLDALVPDVLADMPRDPFSGGPLEYEQRGEGYLLYAVGTNGVDDGGTSGDVVKGEWQPPDAFAAGAEFGLDNVIRLPTPRRGLVGQRQPAPP